uniref:Centromere protein I n=1 Tax=Petromyzon marinus TaxID=7757 RepID=S4RYS4_PETMA
PCPEPEDKNRVLQNFHLTIVEAAARRHGLDPHDLQELLIMALSSKFSLAVKLKMVKCLIPSSVVLGSTPAIIISWMCTLSSTNNVQAWLLRWLVMVFDLIEEKETLHLLYGMIFNYVRYEKLSSYACHLLYLLTRREDVKLFRVQLLLSIHTKLGLKDSPAPHFMGLLSLFKAYCPTLMSLSLPTRSRKYFRSEDKNWIASLKLVQNKNKTTATHTDFPTAGLYSSPPAQKAVGRKRTRTGAIPDLASSELTSTNRYQMDDGTSADNAPTSCLLIRTLPDLLNNIHNLEFPAQMASVLSSDILISFLSCAMDPVSQNRIDFWLSNTLEEGCRGHKANSYEEALHKAEFLNRIVHTQEMLKEGFSSVSYFLTSWLSVWDGETLRPQTLKLLTRLNLQDSSGMKNGLFHPLTLTFISSCVYFKCAIIESLHRLLINLLMAKQTQAETEVNAVGLTEQPTFLTLQGQWHAIHQLVNFISELATAALQQEMSNCLLMHCILDFYQTVAKVYNIGNLPVVLVAPQSVVYPAFLSADHSTLDRLCHLLCSYRKVITELKTVKSLTRQDFIWKKESIKAYNEYVMCIISCLWKSCAFSGDSTFGRFVNKRHFEGEPSYIGEPGHNCGYSLIYHPALLGMALRFIAQGVAWENYVDFLCTLYMKGLKNLIQYSVKREGHIWPSGAQ